MPDVFDIDNFKPEQTRVLLWAFAESEDAARAAFDVDDRARHILAKLVITIGRSRIRMRVPFETWDDALDIALHASELLFQIRTLEAWDDKAQAS
jgi:hypothetical protein